MGIDVFSLYLEMEMLKSTAASKLITKFDSHNVTEFNTYMKELGIEHGPSTALCKDN